MKTMTANQVKTQFGTMLLNVQQMPVQISRYGKPVAVVIPMDDYETMEATKIQLLKERGQRAEAEIESGTTTEGDTFFNELLVEKDD